ncbi:MAG: YlbF family regulator [Verrucomicrobia bacterium]|nr:YlbF family regulator [Verrucomicrobiota bacterium]
MTKTSSDSAALKAAAALAECIQASAEWREMVDAQKAAEADGPFVRMVARGRELSGIRNSEQGRGHGLDGKLLVESITLRDQIQRHELYVRQQETGSAVVRLLQRVNEKISQELGLDFACNAAPRRDECCR